jgi:hypothetical protein
MSTRRSPEQRLAELDRKRARLANQARTAATREKVILGVAVAAEARACAQFANTLRAILLRQITRESDKSAVTAFLENLATDPALESEIQAVEPVAIPSITPETESTISAPDPLAALDGLGARRNRI